MKFVPFIFLEMPTLHHTARFQFTPTPPPCCPIVTLTMCCATCTALHPSMLLLTFLIYIYIYYSFLSRLLYLSLAKIKSSGPIAVGSGANDIKVMIRSIIFAAVSGPLDAKEATSFLLEKDLQSIQGIQLLIADLIQVLYS